MTVCRGPFKSSVVAGQPAPGCRQISLQFGVGGIVEIACKHLLLFRWRHACHLYLGDVLSRTTQNRFYCGQQSLNQAPYVARHEFIEDGVRVPATQPGGAVVMLAEKTGTQKIKKRPMAASRLTSGHSIYP